MLKDAPGWRGPAVLLDLSESTGTANVKWQGKPWLVNLRLIRPHVGFSALFAAIGADSTFSGRRQTADPQTHVHFIFSDGSDAYGTAPLASHGYLHTEPHPGMDKSKPC